MAVSSDEIGVELLAALGIDAKGVRKAVITIETGKAALVDLERFADRPEGGQLAIFKARYHLHALPEPDSAWADITTLCSSSREFAQGIKVD